MMLARSSCFIVWRECLRAEGCLRIRHEMEMHSRISKVGDVRVENRDRPLKRFWVVAIFCVSVRCVLFEVSVLFLDGT